MKISKVGVIGLGALGTMFGEFINNKLPKGDFKIIADKNRIDKYKKSKIYCNNKECNFTYVNSQETTDDKCDLIIFAVKFSALKDAISSAKNYVHKDTIFISLLNGISSEEIIASEYNKKNVLLCTAQGMDAVKEKNKIYYKHMGNLKIGSYDNLNNDKLEDLKNFFQNINFPFQVEDDMKKALWSKLLLNTGVNQSCMVFDTNYGGIQKDGKPRDTMIKAMEEVLTVANAEEINLNEKDITNWLDILSTLSPEGKPSMLQDFEAHRYSEVDLFSGTITTIAKKHHIDTPVNDFFYKKIKSIESTY